MSDKLAGQAGSLPPVVEITPEMIAAAAAELRSYDTRFETPEDMALKILESVFSVGR